ncbi:lytic transglycosylase domain-containing protein [Methylocystis heyeri]|uniref:Transglycosylase SLT domain-containing protein n=1 Tax=Methylocystis heyeri TaxID=391905 RepID=A0A6B8K950_9HYPH|nr:lytic transglycosylase domain-containing protein [Methylocystis heyeri]QGM44794.1 transglycosylase SLT domain-containing protein [Methylocystis heyeri]
MRFAWPFKTKTRTALGLVVGGAALFAHYAPEHSPPARSDARFEPNFAALEPFGPHSWRAKPQSLRDALRRPLDLEPALEQDAEISWASPLLAYAFQKQRLAETENGIEPKLDPAMLVGDDAQGLLQAIASYKSGDFAAGDAAVSTLKTKLAADAAKWVGFRTRPREAGFARLDRFIVEHPDWPAQDWLTRRAEESLFGDHVSDAAVKRFFARRKPLSPSGKLALARVFAREGDFQSAGALAREVWREGDVGEQMEGSIRKEFGELLTVADHKYRADRLLYAEKNTAALRAAELAGKDAVLLARARAAANDDAASDKIFAAVPPELQKDPGLLFARAHMLRKHEKIIEAAAVLLTAPRAPELIVDGDAWWTERRLVARKLLDLGDAGEAYVLCAQHGARSVSAKVEAEFHAGWIALRFLSDPAAAERHFDAAAAIAETPIQKSRALYWRARAAEARHTPEDESVARAYYAEAATHSTTFYGQLALARLGSDASPLRPAPTPAEGDARDESVRVIELLFAAGEKESAVTLAMEAAKHLTGDEQLAALAQTAARARDAKMSLTLGKLASYRGVPLDDIAFPTYGVPQFATLPGSASRSIVYAIARQESAFDPHAVSSAGAMGLMQMIASTARSTALRAGVGFDLRRMLSEPAFNAQLGAAHLGILLNEHKGSYLLTFAAYNAGGKRVKEWIDAYGDPRRANIDPIDWVERIPISETRNYVQRVMENFVVYRAKFAENETRKPQVELAHAEMR